MSNVLVALMLAVGLATWVYTKLYRSTGGNNASSLIAAGLGGGVLFVVALFILNTVVPQ